MRRGFTMIELVFVIVILGILASVALPRLAATRDDATVTRAIADVSTAIKDIGTYYTARGDFGDDFGDMTNVPLVNVALDDGQYKVGEDDDCITFVAADGNLTVTSLSAPTGTVCEETLEALSQRDVNRTYSFGGSSIVR